MFWFYTINKRGVNNLDKQSFISLIKKPLKDLGYRKNRNYWYKVHNDLVFCINVQGSQWDKNDYYVEIGITYLDLGNMNRTIMQWYCRHRCEGKCGEINILPEELLQCENVMQKSISFASEVPAFLINKSATKVANQFWF